MGEIILDSSVVIAFFNPADKHHQAARTAVANEVGRFKISILSVTETLVRAAAVSEKTKLHFLSGLTKNFAPFYPFDAEVASLAASVRASTGLGVPDAIISATATVAKATLWTCDARLAKLHKGARLIA